uniref:Uncharacterized protein n=1 Tax=Spongospora subterranea TaxID=70186 RepID=A0A0H5QN51_9EUKA|eukprot:CRZ03424.1 hypothetical protein [Spongospora subterranea]
MKDGKDVGVFLLSDTYLEGDIDDGQSIDSDNDSSEAAVPTRVLSLGKLVFISFFLTCGGPFGLETVWCCCSEPAFELLSIFFPGRQSRWCWTVPGRVGGAAIYMGHSAMSDDCRTQHND